MSIKIMNRVWESSSHEGSTLLVLLALADHASDDGVCYPSIGRLARKARISKRHTQRLVTDLEDSGEVYANRVGGRQHTSLYFIVLGFSEEEITQTLIKRFELKHSEAVEEAHKIIEKRTREEEITQALIRCVEPPHLEVVKNSCKKGDMQDTLSRQKDDTPDTVSDEKGDTGGTERVTSRAQKGDIQGTKGDIQGTKGDIAMSPEPSLTVIEPSENHQKEPDPTLFELERQTLVARAQSGGNYAELSECGGSDALADHLIAIYCQHMGEAEPVGQEKLSCRATINRVLKRKRLQNNPAMAERGLRVLLDPEGEWDWYFDKYTLSGGERRTKLFETHYGKVLARLLAGGDGYSEKHDGGTQPRIIKVGW